MSLLGKIISLEAEVANLRIPPTVREKKQAQLDYMTLQAKNEGYIMAGDQPVHPGYPEAHRRCPIHMGKYLDYIVEYHRERTTELEFATPEWFELVYGPIGIAEYRAAYAWWFSLPLILQ
jgi:hypothetical protein